MKDLINKISAKIEDVSGLVCELYQLTEENRQFQNTVRILKDNNIRFNESDFNNAVHNVANKRIRVKKTLIQKRLKNRSLITALKVLEDIETFDERLLATAKTDKIAAIRMYRDETGSDLQTSKNYVEELLRQN